MDCSWCIGHQGHLPAMVVPATRTLAQGVGKALPPVFRHEGIDNGVDTTVEVGH